jgi:uncharacterized membrane protein/protein-disulfide isomerase
MKSPWILRFLTLAGLGICSYLGGLKLAGKTTSLAGCGAGSGCSNVLGSEWSQFFGIPVSVLAGAVYLALLITTFRPSRPLYLAFAICLTGAALWFIGLLYLTIKSVCPWCLAMHTIGIVTSIILVLSLHRVPAPHPTTPIRFAPAAAIAALLALALGQALGPKSETHTVTEEVVELEDLSPRKAGREVRILNGKRYSTADLPHLGPPNAEHVIIKYFDYTCSSCLRVHEYLHKIENKYPGAFCTILLPAPLEQSCNPYSPARGTKHQHGCVLSLLSLAAWRAAPDRWPEVHEQLFASPTLLPEVAEAAVGQIVGFEELESALKDPWVEKQLKSGVADYGQLARSTRIGAMPKVVFMNGQVLSGEPREEDFLKALNNAYKLSK